MPCGGTIALVGGKYKAVILWHLIDKVLRFSELQRLVMLTQQLRELERDGLISRKPPKTEYALTAFGESMVPVLEVMCHWGSDYLEYRHLVSCKNYNNKKMNAVSF